MARLPLLALLALLATLVSTSCGRDAAPRPAPLPPVETLLAARADLPVGSGMIQVDDPPDQAVFPPEFVPPTFLWHDDALRADVWLIEVLFDAADREPLRLVVPHRPPPVGEIDPRALGETNAPYAPTPHQASAHAWTPSTNEWEAMKAGSVEAPAHVHFTGFEAAAPRAALSHGQVTIRTSEDEVGAPIFYRDVPLMPGKGERGVIQPLASRLFPLIAWRLRDVSRPESRLVLTDMPSCGNCHSFSLDGQTLGMDIDGPQGDKGTYAIADIEPEMSIDYDNVITWSSFPDKPKGHRTIGFLSRVSPTGRYVVSTLNEELYVANFLDYRVLQVFFPTRGILAVYDTATRKMKALPGADDPLYVHCNGVWSPDEKWIVFSRARAVPPYGEEGRPLATRPNDPNEVTLKYDLYRVPFNGGRGGSPERIEGASQNGMSNTFPKVSPDGRWIVYTKCRNGQLLRPDGRLWIVPFEGGEARKMRCNTDSMNSWHSFSPNGRWLIFSSKVNTPYTQMFLTHLDEEGRDTPAILVPNATASNRAVNLPEFLNAPYDGLRSIEVPAVEHHLYFWRGVDLMQEGRYEEAIELLEKAVEIESEFSRAHVNLGRAHAELGHLDVAVEQYRRALESNPDDVFAMNNLGLAMETLGHPELARAQYESALHRDPTLLLTRQSLARVLLGGPDPQAALVHLEKVVEVEPDDLETRWALAALYLGSQRPREGAHHLEALLTYAPDDVRALSTLAWVLATTSDDSVRDGGRAESLAAAAVRATDRQRPEPLDAWAAALAELGRTEEAAQAARQALALVKGRGSALEKGLQSRLKLYEAGRPYRAP